MISLLRYPAVPAHEVDAVLNLARVATQLNARLLKKTNNISNRK